MYLPLLPNVIWRINIWQIALATSRLEARAFCTVDLLAENCLLLLLCIYKNFPSLFSKTIQLSEEVNCTEPFSAWGDLPAATSTLFGGCPSGSRWPRTDVSTGSGPGRAR